MEYFRFGGCVFGAIVLTISGAARADDPTAFELSDHGAVVEVGPNDPLHASVRIVSRPVPAGEVGRDELQAEDIVLQIDGAHSFPLGRVTRERRHNGLEVPSGVRRDTVRYGLLDGRPDLLLVAWSESRYGGAGGLYAGRGCIIVSLGSEPAVLLRSNDLVSGSMRHTTRTLHRWFGIDDETGAIIERVRIWYYREHERPTPLGRRAADEGGEAVWIVDASAVAQRRIRPYDSGWRPEEWTIRYEGKAGDLFSEISAYFLGSMGTPDAIRRLNPGVSTMPSLLSHDASVRLPIPSQWIDDSIGSEILAAETESRAEAERASDEQGTQPERE